ncbi:MAG: outer membrane protein assembly factor BamD [Bryobacteraceae bacterium]
MRNWRLCVLAAFVLPTLAFAQKKEVQELQRDVALLQDQVRTMQRSIDEKMGAMMVLLQQTLDSSNKSNTSVAVLDSALRDRLRESEKNVAAPVAGLGSKVDMMSQEFQSVKEGVNDVNRRLGKLEQQMVDLGNAFKTMQAPPLPPPTGAAAGPPPVPAEDLYNNAMRDRLAGRLDLALQEFTDYLTWYGETDYAANAQFQIGEIYHLQSDWDNALKHFDLVLEKYPENKKTDDAKYMKGKTLVRMGKRNQGADEFRDLIRKNPRSEAAKKAVGDLKSLGLSAPGASKKKGD